MISSADVGFKTASGAPRPPPSLSLSPRGPRGQSRITSSPAKRTKHKLLPGHPSFGHMSHNGCANGGLALPNSLEVREVLVSDPSRLALLLLPLGLNVLVNGVRLRIEGLESGGSRIVRPTWPDVQSATPTFPTHPGPPALPILDPPGHGPAELSLSLSPGGLARLSPLPGWRRRNTTLLGGRNHPPPPPWRTDRSPESPRTAPGTAAGEGPPKGEHERKRVKRMDLVIPKRVVLQFHVSSRLKNALGQLLPKGHSWTALHSLTLLIGLH